MRIQIKGLCFIVCICSGIVLIATSLKFSALLKIHIGRSGLIGCCTGGAGGSPWSLCLLDTRSIMLSWKGHTPCMCACGVLLKPAGYAQAQNNCRHSTAQAQAQGVQ